MVEPDGIEPPASRVSGGRSPSELWLHAGLAKIRGRGGEWWDLRGSNPRPSRCERDALPAELRARAAGSWPGAACEVAPQAGLEPAASRLTVGCATIAPLGNEASWEASRWSRRQGVTPATGRHEHFGTLGLPRPDFVVASGARASRIARGRKGMVNRSGFEPEASRLKVDCSTDRAHGPCRIGLPS